jgi:hypothetical protein
VETGLVESCESDTRCYDALSLSGSHHQLVMQCVFMALSITVDRAEVNIELLMHINLKSLWLRYNDLTTERPSMPAELIESIVTNNPSTKSRSQR